MDASLGSALIAGIVAIVTAIYTARAHKRMRLEDAARQDAARQRAENPELDKIEKQAYERARASYEAALRVAERRAKNVEDRLGSMEDRVARAEANASNAVARAEAAEGVARRQGRVIAALRTVLRQNGIAIPAHLDGDDREDD